jgi:5-methylthioadenosine/S-adenosylhomocysteine deaminase
MECVNILAIMFDIVLSGCDVLVRRDGRYVVEDDRDIAVRGERIAAIEKRGLIGREAAREWIDVSGQLAIPGLINCHAHVPMVLFRGLAEDVGIESWFNDYIWPLESNLEPEDVYWGMQLGLAEMIQSGVTTVADHYFFCDYTAQAVQEAGTRANITWAVFGHEGEAKLERTVEFVRKWQGAAGGRIAAWLGPHAPYTCDDAFLAVCARRAHELGVGIHIHCSETHEQRELSLQQHGVTPPEVLRRTGVLDVPTILAHGIGITSDDIAMLAQHDVAVAQCAKTYLKLGMGTARVDEFRAAGLKVGIGTDGAVSSNTLDVLEQMRILALDHKQAAHDSTRMPIQTVLEMAFAGGAAAMRMPDIGELAPGKLADVALLRQDGAHVFPRYDALANLMYSHRAGDVETVLCNGRVLLRAGQLTTIDLSRVRAEVTQRLERLNRRAHDRRLATYPTGGHQGSSGGG